MEDLSATDSEAVQAVRRFSRFSTRRLGLLGRRLLKSDFSLTEVRVLYELAHRDGLTATELRNQLDLDAGYLSRLLSKFEIRGLITRETSSPDARRSLLNLTPAGRAAFEPLDRASQDQVAALLSPLTSDQVHALLQAMNTIERLMGDRTTTDSPIILRPHQVGDIGWIAHRQSLLYAREYGWNEEFEALVAQVASRFVKNYDPRWERCWIAEREDRIVGSVFVVRESDAVAKLRLLYVEPEARQQGLGRRLVDECIRFARQKGYSTLSLWTNDVLVSARRIYEAAGFTCVKEEPHHSFGKDLVGQYWELDLCCVPVNVEDERERR